MGARVRLCKIRSPERIWTSNRHKFKSAIRGIRIRTTPDCRDLGLYEDPLLQHTEPRMILVHDFQSSVNDCATTSDGVRPGERTVSDPPRSSRLSTSKEGSGVVRKEVSR